jgi:hypothetical protein
MSSINNLLKERNVRVLVVSNNPFSSTSNNGKTMSSNFREWGTNYIAQLYFSNEIPDFGGCLNYYKITERDQIQTINNAFKMGYSNKTNAINVKKIDDLNNFNKVEWLIRKCKRPFFYILRDIFWSLNIWKTRKLEKFLNEFRPEVVMFLAGNNLFAYQIVVWISKKWRIPVIPYFTDDYLGVYNGYDIFSMFQSYRIKRGIRNIKNCANSICVICDEMGKEYVEKFEFSKYYILYNKNSDYLSASNKRRENVNKVKILYAGNLEFGRWNMLCQIADIVNEIDNNINVSFDIYTTYKLTKSDLKMLSISNRVNFKGAVEGSKIRKLIDNADIVLHVESFDKMAKKSTRLSISTKIFDYLAMGKCILAYGPDDIASIRLLKTKSSAIVVDNKSDLSKILNMLVKNTEVICDYEKKSRALYEEIDRNSTDINDIIKEVITNSAI